MIEIDFKWKGLTEQMKNLAEYDKIVEKHLLLAMSKSVIRVAGVAKRLTPVGVSGKLRRSMGSSVSKDASSVIGKVGSKLRGEVYPSVIEFGRRPGKKMPPPSALERWVFLKMRVPQKRVKGVAYTVARAIGRKGIKGRKMLTRAFNVSRALIEHKYFRQALDAIVKELSLGN